jgi:hypothetical protein
LSKESKIKEGKELCDWSKKDLAEHFDLLCEIVVAPTHVCTKCGRAASDKRWLCKPKKLAASDTGS